MYTSVHAYIYLLTIIYYDKHSITYTATYYARGYFNEGPPARA